MNEKTEKFIQDLYDENSEVYAKVTGDFDKAIKNFPDLGLAFTYLVQVSCLLFMAAKKNSGKEDYLQLCSDMYEFLETKKEEREKNHE